MSEILDKTQAIEQAGGDEKLAKELFGMLLKEAPLLLDKLKLAVDSGDQPSMWDHAHKLYGSTAYCGVPQLRERAKAIEEAIKAKENAEILQDEFNALATAVQSLCNEGTGLLSESWV